MLYVADRCEHHPKFGATKLNKILFYADFIAYIRLGQSVTGAEYQRLPHGPGPRRLVPVRSALLEAGDTVVRRKSCHAKIQDRLVPLREANLDLFSAREISIVDEVIDALQNRSAQEVSDLSHQLLAWQLADSGETIPYYAALLESPDWQPDPEVVDFGTKLAATL